MTHKILTICMYIFIAFCLISLFSWLYDLYTKGFIWNVFTNYLRSFLIFLALSLFTYFSLSRI